MPKVTQLIRGRAEACGLSLSMMPSPGRWGCTLGSLQSNWGVKTHPPHLLENNVRQSSDIVGVCGEGDSVGQECCWLLSCSENPY